MDVEIKSWLYDILQALEEIQSFVTATPDFDAFHNDIKAKRAVERNLEIIGEAMSRILNQSSAITLSNARRIVDTRNRIIHGYDTVSDEILWDIIKQYLPVLQNEVVQLLNA